ncbi:hypothetical protein M3Y95_01270200 [Aphelenchoides besseyi]|nr:hypothetical protein M3Y95_01270200 [Aphelenchoides besseyi]
MDLWSLTVVAAAFVLFYAALSDHRQRMQRDGRGLPVIGLLLNWLTPLWDEFADATSGRRLIAENGGGTKAELLNRPLKDDSDERLHTLQRPRQDKKPTEEELRTAAELVAPLKKPESATTSTASSNVSSGTATAISTDSTATSDSAPSSSSTKTPRKHFKRQHKKKSKRPTKTKSEEKGKRTAKKKSREHKKKDKKTRSNDKPQESSSSSNLSSNETTEENDKKLPRDSFEVDPNVPLKQKKATKEENKLTSDEAKKQRKTHKKKSKKRSKRRSKREDALIPASPKTPLTPNKKKKKDVKSIEGKKKKLNEGAEIANLPPKLVDEIGSASELKADKKVPQLQLDQ